MPIDLEALTTRRKAAHDIVDQMYGINQMEGNVQHFHTPNKQVLAAYASIDGTLALEATRWK